jgi:hypothetical protein
MGSDVIRNLLLGAVVAMLMTGGFVYLQQHREHSTSWREEYARQKDDAGLYCTLSGAIPGGAESLQDPAYRTCVRQRARDAMRSWEADHPRDVWGGLFSGL